MDQPIPADDPTDAAERRALFLRHMRLVPGAVAVVATARGTERTGLAATAWNSLSADPPMLLACINRQSSTHPLVGQARAFSVNLLAMHHEELVGVFGGRRGIAGADRFGFGRWVDGPLGQPLLADAVAAFECTLAGIHDYGTHAILIGEVGAMRGRDEGEALLYLDGRVASTAFADAR